MAVLWRYGFGVSSAVYCILASALVVITFIDLDFQIIPDRITLTGTPLGLLAGSFLLPDPFLRAAPLGYLSSVIGSVSGFSFFFLVMYLSLKILKKEGMGGGDVKMMAMVGAFLGWRGVLLTVFLGSLAGSIVYLPALLRRERHREVPFGVYLGLGGVLSLAFGEALLRWYAAFVFGS